MLVRTLHNLLHMQAKAGAEWYVQNLSPGRPGVPRAEVDCTVRDGTAVPVQHAQCAEHRSRIRERAMVGTNNHHCESLGCWHGSSLL
jgi:hypothetical protein